MDPAAAEAAAAAAAAAMRSFTIEAWTLLAVGILITMLRTYSRIRSVGIRGLQADDYLVWVGAIFYAVETALAHSVGAIAKGMANNGMTDEQRAALSPDSEEYRLRVVGSIIQICGWSSYSVLLWALKASLLVFYLRLTAGLGRGYQLRIYFGFGFLVVSWIAVVMNLFLACRPFHKNWQIYPNPGNVCQPAISNQIVWVYLSFNVSTDLYLLSIPLPMLWQAKLRPAKKYGLLLLFSGGIFVVVCATLRCILIVTDPQNGAQLAGSWAVRETFVAVITANLPMVFSVVKNWLAPVFGSIITSLRSSQKLTEGTPKEIRTFGAGSNQSWRGRGPPSAYPITNVTFSESEERMVNEYKMQDLKPWGDPHGEPVDVGRSDGVQRSQSNRGKNTDIRKDVEVAITTEYVRDSGDELPQDYAYIKGTKRASSQIVSESK
ncbi:hypothetical protein CH063_09363 [Colletotrichum higginsianum]|uniref:Kinesin-like protein n=2 Tax=Colletotrichum higginsianum TaxID=80884 RepID=H1VDB7_COLHI|nr:Kinesin-like protein [Colletotrichum higginsianum IMI 349063]OBR06824.1 Kinesin-like protein [Colletotrichum higginsianum IMI 349063]TIC96992.1 hypothetical protein CH35J_007704 [Colletotrichum higginsianum]CCF38220.1 hypothetical protein CH063_09363 [Colletotrichum higginsianum]